MKKGKIADPSMGLKDAMICPQGHVTTFVVQAKGGLYTKILCPNCDARLTAAKKIDDVKEWEPYTARSLSFLVQQWVRPFYVWHQPVPDHRTWIMKQKDDHPEKIHLKRGGLSYYKIGWPQVDPKSKPSQTILAQELEALNGISGVFGKYTELIMMARSACFDDFAFHKSMPAPIYNRFPGPKVMLMDFIETRYPELTQIRQGILDGKYDDSISPEEERAMNSEFFHNMLKNADTKRPPVKLTTLKKGKGMKIRTNRPDLN